MAVRKHAASAVPNGETTSSSGSLWLGPQAPFGKVVRLWHQSSFAPCRQDNLKFVQYAMRLQNTSVVPDGIPGLIVHLQRLSMCHKFPLPLLSLLSTLDLAVLVIILHCGHRRIIISMCSMKGATTFGIVRVSTTGVTKINGFHSSLAHSLL